MIQKSASLNYEPSSELAYMWHTTLELTRGNCQSRFSDFTWITRQKWRFQDLEYEFSSPRPGLRVSIARVESWMVGGTAGRTRTREALGFGKTGTCPEKGSTQLIQAKPWASETQPRVPEKASPNLSKRSSGPLSDSNVSRKRLNPAYPSIEGLGCAHLLELTREALGLREH